MADDHEAVRAGCCRRGTKALARPLSLGLHISGAEHDDSKSHFSECRALISWSGALAQQSMTGTISRIDEANGKIAIQQTPGGTVGANSGASAEEFKVQDGLVFNAVKPGDKVAFTVTETGGVKTITRLEKQ
jgi:Cu/Ag efflux protein CusF